MHPEGWIRRPMRHKVTRDRPSPIPAEDVDVPSTGRASRRVHGLVAAGLMVVLVGSGCATLCGKTGHRDSILGVVVRCSTDKRDLREGSQIRNPQRVWRAGVQGQSGTVDTLGDGKDRPLASLRAAYRTDARSCIAPAPNVVTLESRTITSSRLAVRPAD